MTNKNDINKIKMIQKVSKWDQLKQKYVSNGCISKGNFARFLDKDFVSENEILGIYGLEIGDGLIDPRVLMDARHYAVKKSKKRRLTEVCSKIDTKTLRAIHDENQYIRKELLKYKEIFKIHTTTTGQKNKHSTSKLAKHKFNKLSNGHHQIVVKSQFVLKTKDCIYNRDLKRIGKKPNKVCRAGQFVEHYHYDALRTYKSNSTKCLTVVRAQDKTIVGTKQRRAVQLKKFNEPLEKSTLKSNKTEPTVMESKTNINVLEIKRLPVTIPTSWHGDGSHEVSSSACTTASNSNERDEIISKLFAQNCQRDGLIVRTFFLKWLHFMTLQRINCETICNHNDRIQKIHAFLDRIKHIRSNFPTKTHFTSDCSKDYLSTLAKRYQNKVKMQEDIINLQKLKLDRQEQTILELRLRRFAEDATESKLSTKQELQAVLKHGKFKHKTKAKCLQITARLQRDENNLAKLQGKKVIIPKFLANMQARAMERRLRHEKAKQRRLYLEAEREAAKHAAEEAKRMEDEQAKIMRIEVLREKRRQEKFEKYQREKQRQKLIENNKKAQEFYRIYLMKKIGLEGFKRLLKRKRVNKKKSDQFRRAIFYKQSLNSWKIYIKAQWDTKFLLAEKHYENTTKTSFFKAWCELVKDSKSKFLAAIDWYEYKITERFLMYWDKINKTNKLIEGTKAKQAESHYDWHMKWKILDHWRRLPQILKLEKLTQERRLRWRMKIWELLPDYRPILHDAN